MGQQQKPMITVGYEEYSQEKPPQIRYLEYLIDNMTYIKIKSNQKNNQSMSDFYGYDYALQSHQVENYKYGVKLLNKKTQQSEVDLQKLNGPVQFYLIANNDPKINDKTTEKIHQQDKLIFQGQLSKGKREQYGAQYDINSKLFYQGFFKNNKYQGWGFTQNYKGQWRKGKKNGYGTYSGKNPKTLNKQLNYQGFWNQDRFDGLGCRNIQISQTQQFLDPQYQCKKTNIDYEYIGQWVQGVKFGCGKYVKNNSSNNNIAQKQIYEGQFRYNNYNGRGKIKRNQEKEFVQGIFQQGQLIKK